MEVSSFLDKIYIFFIFHIIPMYLISNSMSSFLFLNAVLLYFKCVFRADPFLFSSVFIIARFNVVCMFYVA